MKEQAREILNVASFIGKIENSFTITETNTRNTFGNTYYCFNSVLHLKFGIYQSDYFKVNGRFKLFIDSVYHSYSYIILKDLCNDFNYSV